MADITIRHTQEDGTLIEGSAKGDGVFEVLRGMGRGWRYFPSLRQIGLQQSRYKTPKTGLIEYSAEVLRKAGHTVTLEIGTERTLSVAEVERARLDAADDRAERLTSAAANASGRADAAFARADQLGKRFEGGQPILIGHHSEASARNAQQKMWAAGRRGVEEWKESQRLAGAARAAAEFESRRFNPGTTQRRIEGLEAEERRIDRRVNGTGQMIHGEDTPATGSYRERLIARAGEVTEELAYWRAHMAQLEAQGVKIWAKADFTKGDYVRFIGGWYEVVRVNAKSVTIPAMINRGLVIRKDGNQCTWTDTVPYHKVEGRKSAAEMAAILADPARAGELAA